MNVGGGGKSIMKFLGESSIGEGTEISKQRLGMQQALGDVGEITLTEKKLPYELDEKGPGMCRGRSGGGDM